MLELGQLYKSLVEVKEGEKGSDVLIDVLFVRHAEREPIVEDILKVGLSPELTRDGISQAKAFGKRIRFSFDLSFGQYDSVFLSSSCVYRTQQTANAICEGAEWTDNVYKIFPDKDDKQNGSNLLLRLRPDGEAWNSNKIQQSAEELLAEGSPLIHEIADLLDEELGSEAFTNIMSSLRKQLIMDTSQIRNILLKIKPEKKEHIDKLVLGMIADLYDRFLDKQEIMQFCSYPTMFLTDVIRFLKNVPTNRKILFIGITHDFNLAGMIKGFLSSSTNNQTLLSFKHLGGAPDFLSHLHFRFSLNQKGKLNKPSIYYNGIEYSWNNNALQQLIVHI